jgi:hypothetical protein
MSNVIKHSWAIGLILSLGLYCTIREDNGDPSISAPQNETPTLIASALLASPESSDVHPGDTVAISVQVLADSSGNIKSPLSNANIVATTSKGRFITRSLTSDANGRVQFLFTDSIAGRAEITFQTNGAQQTIRLDVTKTPIRMQKLIEIVPGRSIIGADGQDTTTITVQVINDNHNPVAGEYIQFLTTSGIIIGDGTNKEQTGQSKTDLTGTARATLISANINDTAYITAYLVSDQSLSDETDVEFRGMAISIAADGNNLKIGDTALITAKLVNASGKPVPKAAIFFSFTSAAKSNLRFLTTDSLTNYDGIAVAKVIAVANGIDMLNISSSGCKSILQLNVSSLKLNLNLTKIALQTQESDSALLEATFTTGTGTPLGSRTIKLTRSFKTSQGSDTSTIQDLVTNSAGKSVYIIRSLPYECTMRLEAVAFDKAEGYASQDTTILFFTTRIMTIRGPEKIAADGTSKSAITAFIKNKSGNPIIGELISFTTNTGMITAEAKTDTDGKAVAYLTSDRRNITATVSAYLNNDPAKRQSLNVEFSGVTISANANPLSISSNGTDTSKLQILLVDAAGMPISAERINIAKQKDATSITSADSVTNNRGEARCKISGRGEGRDTITIAAAGATTKIVINYSSNILIIDTTAGQPCIANGRDSTRINITYLKGDRKTPVTAATVEIAATIGTIDTVFAKKVLTDNAGTVFFYLKNPSFASTATISVLASKSTEITSESFNLYFKASKVARIDISGTPEVISTDGGRAKITAVAFDSTGNRIKDARISFNILAGPSGGEHFDPPVAITADDGSANTWFVSGKTPSNYRQVWIAASDFAVTKSDTVKLTIAGPPRYITIRANILKGKNPNDGTFGLPCAAIVTDINGNPVADGTDVTFSLKVSGYRRNWLYTTWTENGSGASLICERSIDTASDMLPFEDFNDNYKLDPGEDRNGDGFANRGEDVNGDGVYLPGPAFEDINGDGIRQYNPRLPVESKNQCQNGTISFADLNNNDRWDPIEPLANVTYLTSYHRLLSDSAFYRYPQITSAQDSADFAILAHFDSLYTTYPGFIPSKGIYDINSDYNGIADPNTAISITRTMQTKDGKAVNEIIYGQSDANKIEVMLWAESQGVVTMTPEQLVLPIVSDDE